jgi:cytochrome c oxidase subunit IV
VRAWVDALGYNALLLPPTVWVLGYVLSAVLYLATAGQVGSDRAWAALVIWMSVVVAVLVVSGWPEPPRDKDPA